MLPCPNTLEPPLVHLEHMLGSKPESFGISPDYSGALSTPAAGLDAQLYYCRVEPGSLLRMQDPALSILLEGDKS